MASSLSQGTLCNVIFLASFLCLLLTPSIAKLERFKHNLKGNKPLNFLVIGDWGRKGEFNQSLVAKQMGIVGKKLDIDFVISTGDNFYDSGLTKVDDPAFYDSFVKIYTAPSLQKKWYSVLGNHDYRGVVEPQLSPKLKKKDPRWTCLRSFILEAEIVDFVFVDTTPFVNAYFDNPGKTTYDWKGVLPRKAYLSNLLKDVDSALEKSKAKWKIVVGHHTIKTAGYHNNTVELQDKLVPILKKYKVDAYINGHDHCLEHIIDQESGIHYLTSGAGSKAWRGVVKPMSPKELKLYYDGQGFMSVQITKINVDFVFYDIFGKVLHKSSITKNRKLQA